MPGEDKNDDGNTAELLLGHYTDTFTQIQYNWEARNRFFLYILILISFMALDIHTPGSLSQLINAYIVEVAGNKAPELNFSPLNSMAWFLLLYLVIQYFQRSIHVDRQFNYIDNLENQICDIMGGDFVRREGKSYFSKNGVYISGNETGRPLYLRAVGPLYLYVFPILLSIFILAKIYIEIKAMHPLQFNVYLDIIICLMIVVYSTFYIVWVKFRR